MKRLLAFLMALILVTGIGLPTVWAASDADTSSQAADGTSEKTPIIYTGSKSEINATYKDDAYITVRYLKETTKKLKVKISKLDSAGKETESYTYDLNNKAAAETYSLQMGNGKYTVKVLENIQGTTYAVVQTQTIDINLSDAKAPFLIPIQNINYDDTSKVVAKAKELTKDCKTELEKVQAVYKYVVDNITYDKEKAQKVIDGQLNGYIPVVDTILTNKKGICFDYSSLMGAMLRSLGIPTKLVMGYVAPNSAYHAWNEVYITGTGWIKINSSVYFDGKTYSRMDSTFAAGNKSGKQTEFIGNGKNYSKKYEY